MRKTDPLVLEIFLEHPGTPQITGRVLTGGRSWLKKDDSQVKKFCGWEMDDDGASKREGKIYEISGVVVREYNSVEQ